MDEQTEGREERGWIRDTLLSLYAAGYAAPNIMDMVRSYIDWLRDVQNRIQG